MDNNIVYTKEDLLTIYLGNNYNTPPNEALLNISSILLNKVPEFNEFLWKKKFDYFELPYILFGEIIEFIQSSLDQKEYGNIKNILSFLDEMSQSKDKNVLDLLMAGALEVFDNQKEILPDIIKFMPPNLKKVFLKHFSHYLNM